MGRGLDDHLDSVKAEARRRNRDNIANTAITSVVGAGLAYWAWHTVAHAAFGLSLFFTVSAVGNRISYELFQIRARRKASEILNREEA